MVRLQEQLLIWQQRRTFCIASDKAKFIQAFVGVGLAPDAGGLFLLGRAIGLTRATQLAMTGEPLGAEKALEYGVVYKVSEVVNQTRLLTNFS